MLANRDLPNVTSDIVEDWTEFVEGTRAFDEKARPEDWFVIDLLGPASWEAVQTWYIDKRFGMAPEDFFLAHQLAKKKGNELDGDTDWKVINKNHRALMTLIQRMKCNVICTATAKAIGERDDPQLRSTYGAIGLRPTGQKEISHDFHTLVVLTKSRQGDWQMTTVGDRERVLGEKVPLNEFALDYLVKVAKWRPGA